jgi:colanic acid biosynthesis glycosyl transferase WcaI
VEILIVSQYFWPENFRINDLVKELLRRGHCVTVLTGVPNYPDGKLFPLYQQDPSLFSCYEGATVLRAPMLPRGRGAFRLFLNYLSFVVGASIYGPWKLRTRAFDVIFVFEPSPVTVGLPAILISRIKQAPVVFWALDLWPDTLAALGVIRSPKVLSLVARLVRFIYDRCTLVLGQSRGFLSGIAKHCSEVEKIRYFPSWAEENFEPLGMVLAPEVPVRDNVFNVLFAGNIGEAQDFPAVLDAAQALKNNVTIRWLIVGDGRMFNWLAAEVRRRGLEKNFLLLGRFPIERMPSFYAHAHALLVSLKRDPVFSLTIPGKVQSYLMTGVPLLGMLDGEGAQVIKEANAGLTCAAGDTTGLVDAVLKLAALSAGERHELGVNGRAFAQREFARPMLIDRLESFLHEAVVSHTRKKR